MHYFGNRRPRGFHHTFIYVDERKEWRRRHNEADPGTEQDAPADKRGGKAGAGHASHAVSWRGTGHTPSALRIGVWPLLAMALACMALAMLLLGADAA